ncbi:hypothetical protein ACK6D9_18125 [Hoeflea sp. Naph1]
MLYVFNNANSVQIAWNNVLPTPNPKAKSRLVGLSNFIRTYSAG